MRRLADRVGLTGQLSAAAARRSFTLGDRGRGLVDLATTVTAGGEARADITGCVTSRAWGSGRVTADDVAGVWTG